MAIETGKKVLVVDDGADVVHVISHSLKAAGYEISVAKDGKEALKLVESWKPDLVVLDVVMPVLDGFAVYKELRKNSQTAKLPVIILTARGKMEETFKAMDVDEFLVKPVDTAKLMACIERLLHVSPQAPAASQAPAAPQPVPVQSAVSTKPPILVAGDPSEHLQKLIAFLKSKDKEVFHVQSSQDIIKQCIAVKPQALVLDVYLNEASSEETVKAVRENASFTKVPIILYSSIEAQASGGSGLSDRIASVNTAKDNCMAAGATSFTGQLTDKNFASLVFVSLPL